MKNADDVWEMLKKLPAKERFRIARRAIEEIETGDNKEERVSALEAFLAGTKYRWIRTDRDEWHAR